MPTLPKPPSGGGDWVQLDSGTYLGICYAVIELGSHQVTYQGVDRPGLTPQILLRWELPEIDAPARDDGTVMPATIGKRYTWSMSEKANLRKDLESWRGKAFEQSDFGPTGFEIFDIIGVPATLNVLRTEKNGKVYSDVKSVGKAMRGMTIPPMQHGAIKLGLNPREFDREAFEALSDGIRSKIEDSPEYASLLSGGKSKNSGSYAQQSGKKDEMDDEIPF
jgi:hypothetical protein